MELILSGESVNESFDATIELKSVGLMDRSATLDVTQDTVTRLLVRVDNNLPLARNLLEQGFHIAGCIGASQRLCAANIEPHFPVESLVSGPVAPAIVLGRANVNLLAQVRALGGSGVPVYCVLTRGEPALIARSSRYTSGVFDCRGGSDEVICDAIRHIAEECGCSPIVFTGGDLDIALLARIWPSISGFARAVSDPDRCSHFNDKRVQIDTVSAAGIRVPESRVVDNIQALDCLADLTFPIISKPLELARKGAFRGKIFVAENEDDLRSRLEPVLDTGSASILLQEYVPGGIENLLFALVTCGDNGEVRWSVTGRKLEDNTKGGMGTGETLKDPELDRQVARTFQAFGVGGLLGVEFKRHPVTGELFYIESNFRPENIHSVNEAAGVNLQLAAYLQAVGLPTLYEPLPQRQATWMDLSLVFLARLKQKGWQGIWPATRGTVADALWARGDLRPGVVWYALKITSLVRRSFGRVIKRRH
ncbi:hypothetical protein NLU14_09495 [Marinobacter sp. 71-i]|uniref:ATP-grasp domain-containing protein n=1 Tax=Marinobacter iranensis TaxID=2962607 RepID=A0ABT5Y9W2_9GAMM|nr:hypothetical protein [Marinobacter iranensis]MDF0750465.1 hypothetical protein [Marinobacter iranensis]